MEVGVCISSLTFVFEGSYAIGVAHIIAVTLIIGKSKVGPVTLNAFMICAIVTDGCYVHIHSWVCLLFFSLSVGQTPLVLC